MKRIIIVRRNCLHRDVIELFRTSLLHDQWHDSHTVWIRLVKAQLQKALVSSPVSYRRVCKADDPVEQVECAVLQSVSELLLLNQTDRIRECKGCGWRFFDATRNSPRRGCTMDICGNRAKAKRHYARTRRTAKAARP